MQKNKIRPFQLTRLKMDRIFYLAHVVHTSLKTCPTLLNEKEINPEELSDISIRLQKHLIGLQAQKDKAWQAKEQALARLHMIQVRLLKLKEIHDTCRCKLNISRKSFLSAEKACKQAEAACRAEFSGTEQLTNYYQPLLNKIETVSGQGALSLLTPAGDCLYTSDVPENQTAYEAVQAEIETKKARLDRQIASVQKSAAYLIRQRSELKQIRAKIELLKRRAERIKTEINGLEVTISSKQSQIDVCKEAQTRLESATAMWSELKALLILWLRACSRLYRQTKKSCNSSLKNHIAEIENLEGQIKINVHTQINSENRIEDIRELARDFEEDLKSHIENTEAIKAKLDKEDKMIKGYASRRIRRPLLRPS